MTPENPVGLRPQSRASAPRRALLLWPALAVSLLLLACQGAGAEQSGPLWLDATGLTEQATQLLSLMHDAESYGLRSADYAVPAMQGERRLTDDPAAAARLDGAITAAVQRFVTHLHYGRVDASRLGFNLAHQRRDLDVAAAVQGLAHSGDLAAAVAALEPRFYHYQLLKAALARYRKLAARPELNRLPPFASPALRAGDRYAGAGQLRELLAAEGDLGAADANPASDGLIDAATGEALASFQRRHDLPVTGHLDRRTFAALTTAPAVRVCQIELALERARWLPPLESPSIIVNIPQFELFAFPTTSDREPNVIKMPVIVGKVVERTRTPIFIGAIRYLIFRPYWNVPRDILERELLPKIRANPGYVAANDFEIVRGESDESPVVEVSAASIEALDAGQLRLRQRPGPDNALGLVKFVFPNSHDIYLHGTSAPQLFRQSGRALSHGCIRVADPVTLAAYVLRGTPGDWTPERISAAMADGNSRRVDVQKPVTVIIYYSTVLATESGQVFFFNDIYGHDRRLAAALARTSR